MKFERRANKLGYGIDRPDDLLPVSWLGPRHKSQA